MDLTELCEGLIDNERMFSGIALGDLKKIKIGYGIEIQVLAA